MNQDQVQAKLRGQNIIYECILCKKMKNAKEETAYAVSALAGIMPGKVEGIFSLQMATIFTCETCYNNNLDDKGLHFKEPSPIVKAEELPNHHK